VTRGPYVVRRVSTGVGGKTPLNRWLVAGEAWLASVQPRVWLGYVGAVLGVTAASILIGIIQDFIPFRNISIIYLFIVLWLAATFGRGPALAASVLAFFAYDYFFIPPLYQFTVHDPTEWLTLFMLLTTALVLGQQTASIQARAREAMESQTRTATLYALSQLIISSRDEQTLLDQLAERIVSVFRESGAEACSIVLADERDQPVVRAVMPATGIFAGALSLTQRERHAQATTALQHREAGGSAFTWKHDGVDQEGVAFYLPLRSVRGIVGALGIAGKPTLRRLVLGSTLAPAGTAIRPQTVVATQDERVTLFAAFCDQIALALDQFTLRHEIIHAEALRESDRLKTALLGSVTHDLRTPLAAIQAAAGSLLEEDIEWSPAERRAFAETIETSAERLTRLVSNLLDVSRLEAGVLNPERRWHALADVIAAVLDRLELAGRMSGRDIVVDIPDDLPLAFIDHAQIEQVLTNLIENAIKYSPPGSPITVRARAAADPPAIEVEVIDKGIGIPPGELRSIFDKFYRVQHVDLPWDHGRPPTGTGLGLAICAGIVQAHGGSIWAESEPGQGTTIVFTLPLPVEAGTTSPPDVGESLRSDAEAQAVPPAGAAQKG
jgi:two-component system sensor histidine kinase KdpD